MSARSSRSGLLALGWAGLMGVAWLGLKINSSRHVTGQYQTPNKPTLVVYTYDSFVAQGGLGPEIFPAFEKECGCTLKVLPSGDGGQLVNRLQIDAERGKPQANVVLGLDETAFERAKPWIEPWRKGWSPKGMEDLANDLRKIPGFLPFDYGYFAFMADRNQLHELKLSPPTSFSDLLKPQWKRNLILEDPRTSTPGLAFVLYADAVASKAQDHLWSVMRSQWLTLPVGWDSAYNLFLRKEAPLVWSYTTSQAYHEAHGDSPSHRRYEALVFDEGQPMQVEGAALVKGSFPAGVEGEKQQRIAEDFLQYLISASVQEKIPLHNWMYPARKSVELPPSFRHLPKPKKVVHLPIAPEEVKAALSNWSKAVEGVSLH